MEVVIHPVRFHGLEKHRQKARAVDKRRRRGASGAVGRLDPSSEEDARTAGVLEILDAMIGSTKSATA